MSLKEFGLGVVYGNPPSKSNCYTIITLKSKAGKVHGSLGKTKALKEYEDKFYMQLQGKYRNLNIDSLFEFYIDAYMPSMRTDLDNILKCVLDCLQKTGTIKNDNLAVKIEARKFVDKENPRVEFYIKKVA